MKFISFFLLLYFFSPFASLGQTNYTWNGSISTDYQVAGNWTPSRNILAGNDILAFNATSVINVDNVANQNIGSLQITGGTNTINFASNTSGNTLNITGFIPINFITTGSILIGENLTFQLSNSVNFILSAGTIAIAPSTGGKLSINGQLTIDGGTIAVDVTGTGGMNINPGMSIIYKKGNFACTTSSSINWLAGSTYYHNADGSFASTIPAAAWQRGSNCVINGLSAAANAPTGLNANIFSNLIWNCPNQFGVADLLPANAILTIIDTLTVINTNAKELRLSSTGKVTLKVGTYIQTGGNITMQSSATVDTSMLTVFGSFLQSAGNLNALGGSSPGIAILDFRGNVFTSFTASWTSTGNNSSAQQIIQFAGTVSQNITLGASWNSPVAGRCNIINQNSDLVNGINLTGTLKVINTNSLTSASLLMAGVITGSGAVSYAGSSTFPTILIYGGGFFLLASTKEFPSSGGPTNLTINNLLGVSFPVSFNRTIIGTLNMISGNLSVGNGNSLNLNNSSYNAQLTYTKGFITSGTLTRSIAATGLPTSGGSSINFPFGNGDNDRKLGIYFSNSSINSGGTVAVTFVSMANVTNIALVDNGIMLDKRSNSYWNIATTGINLGSATAALIVSAANIGTVQIIDSLRLTDAITSYGNLINSTGTNNFPIVGKSGLALAELNKTIYIGSSTVNPLIIITYVWTGDINSDWTNAGNWISTGAGYPNSSTENAVITGKTGIYEPTINNGTAISIYQLTVGNGLRLTLAGTAGINLFDTANFSGGLATFASTSTFGYFSSNNPQLIADLPYGNLTLAGLASKTYSLFITTTGNYSIAGFTPLPGTNTFTYAGSGSQRIAATNYYNLVLTGARSSAILAMGNNTTSNIIDVKNQFLPGGLNGTYTINASFNTFNFSDPTTTGSQIIPGFTYQTITNSNGNRTFDNLGSTNVANGINCFQMTRGLGTYTVGNSKVRFISLGLNSGPFNGSTFHDIEFSGNYNGFPFDFFNGTSLNIAGNFSITATNFKLATSGNVYRFNFNGTGNQTIPAFKTVDANTPAFKYSNLFIAGGNRNVTLSGNGTDTIFIRGKLTPEFIAPSTTSFFSAGKGFIVTNSVVEFSTASNDIPVLKPLVAGGINYNNIVVSGGTQKFGGDMIVGGNVNIKGTAEATLAILQVGVTGVTRVVTVLGNISITGDGTGSTATALMDMNTGTAGNASIKLAGNLSIVGNGQLMGTTTVGNSNGLILFNGINFQTYSNTSTTFKNGMVNFTVGDGTSVSKLTLLNSLNLLASNNPVNKGTLTISNLGILDCGINNINSYGSGNALFNLSNNTTFITANTGGIEGTATSNTTGTIVNDATMMKSYSPTASYVFNASAHTNMSFPAATTPFLMANLTIGDSINAAIFSLNKSIDVYNVLTFKKSVGFDLLNSNLTLKSTSSATCRVDQVPLMVFINYSGTGRFFVERYFPALRAWRLITAPLSGNNTTATIFSEWQNNGIYAPNVGTYITGASPNIATNGLDASSNNGYSLKTFQNNAYVNVGNTLTPISNSGTSAANIGYFLFVRGDRTASNFTIPNANNTTLSIKGKLQYGTQTFSGFTRMVADGSRKFSLIGNPYPSPVNFNSLTRVNLIKRFIVWDPKLATTGAFVTSDDLTNSGVYTQDIVRAGGQDVNIQSSQAFFIETDAAIGPSGITFNEGSKTIVNNLNLFRPASPVNSNNSLRSCLYYVNKDNSTQLADGNLVEFRDNFSNNVDLQDASKFSNINENFALLRNGNSIAMERRQPIVANDTLFFNLSRTTQRQYRFQFQPTGFYPGLIAFIEDSYLKTKTEVNLFDSTTHDFSIGRDIKSVAANRFKIVFSTVPVEVLPVTFTNIKAYQQAVDIAVEWSVENEINITKYAVEKSVDGINFNKINITIATTANGSKNYKYVDINAVDGNNFYRILSYHLSGTVEYSRVLIVKIGKASASEISISPNPVTRSLIGLSFNNMKKGVYQLRIISALGQTVMTRRISLTQGNGMETINPGKKLIGGIYQLQITSPDKNITTIKMIVQ